MDHLLPDVDTHQEILQYNVDQSLPSFQDGDDVVRWWACVDYTGKYPGLCQAVKAAMSIFHGPLVESSFNIMGNIIDQRTFTFKDGTFKDGKDGSTSMNINTFSAIQTVKYTLQSRKMSAVNKFSRDESKFEPVDRRLCGNIILAGTRDKSLRQQKQLKVSDRRVEFVCQPSTSAAVKRAEVVEEESVARKRHMAKQRKRVLEGLPRPKE